ncbi:YceD family protein [Streptococcus macacae]|uniref:ACR n=1 Tax=Streptococcus macacae NCTC 11558 TaxID=764298 RepID=G5JUY7_9STRE|nr:DUF177 domain-containing protein [Streptococcus macacae]EHJ53007.1 hypothetical protein STRMA_1372 [Streptococcus macacae NCTC 11558]SUN79284.1 putative metal-binding, possibly nucleicacid-binding protein [Streptococcus macacae NCTC 11558]
MFNINDIKKIPEGISFNENLSLESKLMERSSQVLALDDVTAKGKLQYDDGFYLLNYQLDYTITLPSSRSLEAVVLENSLPVHEVFIEASEAEEKQELVEDDLVLVLEDDAIDLEESIMDNILLNIPLKVLTADEKAAEKLPSGQNWNLLSEEQYQSMQKEKKAENSPFAALTDFFDE